MSKTHWKKLQNPDYLGAYALDIGQELILTIDSVKREVVTGPDGKKEECTVMYFVEPQKPMIVNTTNAKTIAKLYRTPYIEDWHGRKIQIYAAKVKAFGELVDALRIRPTIPKSDEFKPIQCANCGTHIQGFGKMTSQEMAKYTENKYGKPLCSECAKKAADSQSTTESLGGKSDEDN